MKRALEIINKNKRRNMDGYVYDNNKSAKEIHKHYLKFSIWLLQHSQGKNFYVGYNSSNELIWYDCKNDKQYTLDEVYQDYCDEILHK